jgi:hypothetical protein
VVRSLALVAGVVVAALVVALAYLLWWPSLLQALQSMHGMR